MAVTHLPVTPELTPTGERRTKKNRNAPIIQRGRGNNPLPLRKHQIDAIKKMGKVFGGGHPGRQFSGLIVIPTGGGKTRTAVHWILQNIVDKGKKVLWIAHRDTLLTQACLAFERNAYPDVLREKDKVRCRIVCGTHDKAIRIEKTDDIILASIQSLRTDSIGIRRLLKTWLKDEDEVFLVIDEAHHAPARTYRNLISTLKGCVKSFNMLGLTATPFRTAEREKGLIRKLFTDDIVFSTGLQTLITRRFLSKPVFSSAKTKVQMQELLKEPDMTKLKRSNFDFDKLGKRTTETLTENSGRNNFIVGHYIKHKVKYGQTLVFALNVDNAIALNKLFKERGVRSTYVVSGIYDAAHRVQISPKENDRKIREFRDGKIDVLINVNIVTEGVDLPNVQSVFLARPTSSKVLMMQMIGRGLRGPEAKGTERTYIVSFIDEWKDKIDWANAEQLFINSNVDFEDKRPDTVEGMVRLVSIEKIEEFANLLNETIDTQDLEALPFLERVPVGFYSFGLIQRNGKRGSEETHHVVLVFSSMQQAYEAFVDDLPELFKVHGIADDDSRREWLPDKTLRALSEEAEREYFHGIDEVPGYRLEDIRNILQCYYVYGSAPELIPFEQRPRFDIDKVAREIYGNKWNRDEEKDYMERLWNNQKNFWQAFFGFDKKYFFKEIYRALQKLTNRDMFTATSEEPRVEYPLRPLEEFSLEELWETHPARYRELKEQVYRRARDKDGNYTCAISGKKSPYRIEFEIDHKKPMSEGGLTTKENLQLLTRWENRKKGSKLPSDRTKEQGPSAKKTPATRPQTIKRKPPTKSEILVNIADATGLTKKQVASWFEALAAEIKKNLGRRGPGVFVIPGLLKIEKKKIPARPAKKGVPNPFRPGKVMDVQARPAFCKVEVQPLKKLKEIV